MAITLDGHDTAAKVRRALRETRDAADGSGPYRGAERYRARAGTRARRRRGHRHRTAASARADPDALARVAAELELARRPVLILGLDLDPYHHAQPARAFAERLGVPVFVTPKAKGLFPEDHPLFCGVCAGVAGDSVILDFFKQSDLLVGLGFEPVESDKLWHRDMTLVSIGPVSIARGDYRPHAEAVGDVRACARRSRRRPLGPYAWTPGEMAAFRDELTAVLQTRRRR